MKTMFMFIVMLVTLLFIKPLEAQINYDWGIVTANSDSIYAYVHAVNHGHETLGILYQNWPWVELYINNTWDMNAPDMSGIVASYGLIIWDEYTDYVSYNPGAPIPPGNYTADVRHYQSAYNYVPFLDTLTVHIPDIFDYITFSQQVTHTSQDFIMPPSLFPIQIPTPVSLISLTINGCRCALTVSRSYPPTSPLLRMCRFHNMELTQRIFYTILTFRYLMVITHCNSA